MSTRLSKKVLSFRLSVHSTTDLHTFSIIYKKMNFKLLLYQCMRTMHQLQCSLNSLELVDQMTLMTMCIDGDRYR